MGNMDMESCPLCGEPFVGLKSISWRRITGEFEGEGSIEGRPISYFSGDPVPEGLLSGCIREPLSEQAWAYIRGNGSPVHATKPRFVFLPCGSALAASLTDFGDGDAKILKFRDGTFLPIFQGKRCEALQYVKRVSAELAATECCFTCYNGRRADSDKYSKNLEIHCCAELPVQHRSRYNVPEPARMVITGDFEKAAGFLSPGASGSIRTTYIEGKPDTYGGWGEFPVMQPRQWCARYRPVEKKS